jgi:hypothetical protein
MSFQPGQTVRWCASLRADWAADQAATRSMLPEMPHVEPPVGRVLKVGIGQDPGAASYCGVCGPPASRCPGPFVLVEFWGHEGLYAEHELEPA